ncbi:cyclic-di-AMP receptor [Carnobacteriaceae bacterium zg-ZUI240]|nr:cyclic-di-AMP receptor [Carnobacteriaceae bacterium zg-ZUI240]
MKLVIAIVHDKDVVELSKALVDAGFRSTKLNSTGGLLRAGSTTFMIGVEDDSLDILLALIKDNCSQREEMLMQQSMLGVGLESLLSIPVEVTVGGATVFVLPIEQFTRF